MLGFRWVQRIRFPLGIRSSITRNGVGFSWGIPGARVGLSPTGRKWISLGFPAIGLYFFRYLGKSKTEREEIITDDEGNVDVLNVHQASSNEHIGDDHHNSPSVEKKPTSRFRKWKTLK
jgi:hypothetical protein